MSVPFWLGWCETFDLRTHSRLRCNTMNSMTLNWPILKYLNCASKMKHCPHSVRARPKKSTLELILWQTSYTVQLYIFFRGSTALAGLGVLIAQVSGSYSDSPHSVRLFWTSDRSVPETTTWQHTALTTSMPPAGLEPTIPASERPQTLALDRGWSYHHRRRRRHIIIIIITANKSGRLWLVGLVAGKGVKRRTEVLWEETCRERPQRPAEF